MKKIGITWLQDRLNIQGFRFTHESYIGTTEKTELSSTNTIVRTFKSKYDVKTDSPMSHLEFALKYDDLNLAFIKEVFLNVEHQTIEDYSQKIHYVCPPPQFVRSLMQGLVNLNKKNESTETILKATMVSFG